MGTFLGTSINESPTVVFPAGENLANARGIAVVLDNGEIKKAGAGSVILGLAIIETDDSVNKGDDVDVQIKDIGKWVTGAANIKAGDLLTPDADGKAVVAASGDFIAGIALSSAQQAGTWIKVQITKSGFQAQE